jgi:hypothetical protein
MVLLYFYFKIETIALKKMIPSERGLMDQLIVLMMEDIVE